LPAPIAASDPSASEPSGDAVADRLRPACVVAMALCLSLFVVAQYGRLGHPLLWQDEGETAMFGRRILEHGYPKVHGEQGVVYGMNVPMAYAVDPETDAYTGSLWGQYLFAAPAVWLSDATGEHYLRTALLRLPFALAGSAGLWLLWLAYAPAFGPRGRGGRRCAVACVYALGLATSVSLLLHLREARYYALVTALVGLLLWLRQRASGALRGAGTALALFALFNTFYPAAVAVAAWLVLESLLPLAHGDARTPAAWRARAIEWAPLGVAALALAPIVVWFRMIPLSELMSARYQFGLADYAVNLLVSLRHLSHHELLLAAGLLRLAAWQVGRGVARPAEAPALWRLVLVWVAISARNPIFFERYIVALAPLLLMAALLDFDRLREAVVRHAPDRARSHRVLAAIAGVCVAGTLALRAPEIAGRARELVTPVRGPLDVAIPWVQERFGSEAPSVTVATNYEAEVWMFYLGGGQVVGRFHPDTEAAARAEAAVRPDLVVPRNGYPHMLRQLGVYLTPGAFERHLLDVADMPYNTIPELSRGRVVAVTHWFETVPVRYSGQALQIWVRRPSEGAP